ncbi:MAG: NUDIX hydrolase [candidate division Zixibacteria bacterium]|nr:NUDIX hydrolase [candidate division Zixibacteria bacterium]
MPDKLPENEHKLVISKEFSYCPWCSTKLIDSHIDGKNRKRCPNCDFIYYRNPIPAAGAIIEDDGKILLVKRKYPPYVGDWCFPAGFMEYGESPSQCCIREVAEETGLKIELTSSFKIYSGDDDPRYKAVLVLYIAEIIGGDFKPGDDASELQYFPFDSPPENIAFESHVRAFADYIRYKNNGRLPDPNE